MSWREVLRVAWATVRHPASGWAVAVLVLGIVTIVARGAPEVSPEEIHLRAELEDLDEELQAALEREVDALAKIGELEAEMRSLRGEIARLQPEEPEPSPEPEDEADNEKALLRMLQNYVALYNQGDYIQASTSLSADIEGQCGGPTDLAFALSQNHRIEDVDYEVVAVRMWDDDPNMADVVTIERYGGGSSRLTLGLAFVHQSGQWKLDDLYPLGAGAFCD